jgi:hypothetical protein
VCFPKWHVLVLFVVSAFVLAPPPAPRRRFLRRLKVRPKWQWTHRGLNSAIPKHAIPLLHVLCHLATRPPCSCTSLIRGSSVSIILCLCFSSDRDTHGAGSDTGDTRGRPAHHTRGGAAGARKRGTSRAQQPGVTAMSARSTQCIHARIEGGMQISPHTRHPPSCLCGRQHAFVARRTGTIWRGSAATRVSARPRRRATEGGGHAGGGVSTALTTLPAGCGHRLYCAAPCAAAARRRRLVLRGGALRRGSWARAAGCALPSRGAAPSRRSHRRRPR